MKTKIIPLIIAGCLCATLVVAFEAGKPAFTKHYETALLEEPQPLAKSVATLPFAASVKITTLQDKWAQVSSDNGSGWVYLGNLAEDKPDKDYGIQGLSTGASATTASVAARPLGEEARNYADQKGLKEAAADVEWLEKHADNINGKVVVEYLNANKKGEFQ